MIDINESKRAASSQTIFASQSITIKELGLAFKQASSSANELIEILALIRNDKPGRKEE